MARLEDDSGMTFDIPANGVDSQGEEIEEIMRRISAYRGLHRALESKGYPPTTRTIIILGEEHVIRRNSQD